MSAISRLAKFSSELDGKILLKGVLEIVFLGAHSRCRVGLLLGALYLSSAPWALVSFGHLFLHNVCHQSRVISLEAVLNAVLSKVAGLLLPKKLQGFARATHFATVIGVLN